MKEFIQGMYQKPHFGKRLLFCFIAVCVMGFCVSWLSLINLGTDPCSVMNFGISARLGISFGNWQALLNLFLFFIVIWKDKSKIGFGTILNMILVGYACDLTTWVRQQLAPELVMDNLVVRIMLMLVMLAIFVVAVAVYLSVELGTAPYDAIPMIIADVQDKLSFRTVRILWDCSVTLIGFLVGGTVGIVTILMAFTIGPVAVWVSRRIQKFIQ